MRGSSVGLPTYNYNYHRATINRNRTEIYKPIELCVSISEKDFTRKRSLIIPTLAEFIKYFVQYYVLIYIEFEYENSNHPILYNIPKNIDVDGLVGIYEEYAGYLKIMIDW